MEAAPFRDGLTRIMRPDISPGDTAEWILRDDRGRELERRKFEIDKAGDARIVLATTGPRGEAA